MRWYTRWIIRIGHIVPIYTAFVLGRSYRLITDGRLMDGCLSYGGWSLQASVGNRVPEFVSLVIAALVLLHWAVIVIVVGRWRRHPWLFSGRSWLLASICGWLLVGVALSYLQGSASLTGKFQGLPPTAISDWYAPFLFQLFLCCLLCFAVAWSTLLEHCAHAGIRLSRLCCGLLLAAAGSYLLYWTTKDLTQPVFMIAGIGGAEYAYPFPVLDGAWWRWCAFVGVYLSLYFSARWAVEHRMVKLFSLGCLVLGVALFAATFTQIPMAQLFGVLAIDDVLYSDLPGYIRACVRRAHSAVLAASLLLGVMGSVWLWCRRERSPTTKVRQTEPTAWGRRGLFLWLGRFVLIGLLLIGFQFNLWIQAMGLSYKQYDRQYQLTLFAKKNKIKPMQIHERGVLDPLYRSISGFRYLRADGTFTSHQLKQPKRSTSVPIFLKGKPLVPWLVDPDVSFRTFLEVVKGHKDSSCKYAMFLAQGKAPAFKAQEIPYFPPNLRLANQLLTKRFFGAEGLSWSRQMPQRSRMDVFFGIRQRTPTPSKRASIAVGLAKGSLFLRGRKADGQSMRHLLPRHLTQPPPRFTCRWLKPFFQAVLPPKAAGRKRSRLLHSIPLNLALVPSLRVQRELKFHQFVILYYHIRVCTRQVYGRKFRIWVKTGASRD